MNKILTVILGICSTILCMAQNDSLPRAGMAVSAGPSTVIGEFADTHPFGFDVSFNYKLPAKKAGISIDAGLQYLFGKQVMVSGQSFNYSNYSILHLAPGFTYHLSAKGNIGLYAGPCLNLFEGYSEFGLLIMLNAEHYFSNHFGINPSISWVKLSKADPIIMFSAKAIYRF